jgi:hypothetical protein
VTAAGSYTGVQRTGAAQSPALSTRFCVSND